MFPEWLTYAMAAFNLLAVIPLAVITLLAVRRAYRTQEENNRLRVEAMKAGCERADMVQALKRRFPPPQAEVELDEAWMGEIARKMMAADPKVIMTGTVKLDVHSGTYEILYDDGAADVGRIKDLVPERMERDHG